MTKLYTSDIVAELPDPTTIRRVLAVLAGLAVGWSMCAIAVYFVESYGAVLFLFTPFAMGLAVSVALHRRAHVDRVRMGLLIFLMLALAVVMAIVLAVEGLVCLVMAMPLVLPLALLGGEAGIFVAERRTRDIVLGLLILPASAGVEATVPANVSPRMVLSTVEIDATPARVWRYVIAFPPLDEPTEWWFRAGLAYPRYASIEGSGVGAVRSCVFSTGPFVEPITAWEPGRRLAFDVTESPAPLRELSIWNDVHPPHLDGYFRARKGEFRLIPLPGGRMRLEGRTWYELDMSPGWYWQWMTDRVVHGIHNRVLEHIKRQSESNSKLKGAAS